MMHIFKIVMIVFIFVGVAYPNNVITAKNLNKKGIEFYKKGNYTKALSYYKKSLAIREKVLGKKHLATGQSHNNIAVLYRKMGDYPKALNHYKKSISIREKVFGEKDPKIAKSYNNIGILYENMGNYPKALNYHKKSISIKEKVLGKKHPDTARSYNSLGLLYGSMGDYKNSLNYYKKSLSIREKVLGKRDLNTARSYNNIGVFYEKIGDYSESLKYHKKSLSVREEVLGKEHQVTAQSYNNIGLLYQSMGKYLESLNYYKKSLSIREKVLTKNHSSIAISYNNLGALYEKMDDHPKALSYFQKSLALREKVLSSVHPRLATGYSNIGVLYRKMGDYPKALKNYNKSLVIQEKVLGSEHPATARSYNNIGVIHEKMGEYPKAYFYAKKSFDAFISSRDKNFQILDNKQKKQYLKLNRNIIPLLLNTATEYLHLLNNDPKKTQQILQSGTNAWLNYKGSIFDSENAIAMLYSSTRNKKIKAKIDDLISSKRYLAKLYQSLPRPKKREAWKNNIKDTKEKIRRLTNEISSKATNFKEQQGLKSISYNDITSHLKDNELYIDYAKVGEYYYLFTLDHKEDIEFVQIDENSTQEIDSLVKSFREDVNTILNDNNMTNEQLKRLTRGSKEKLSQLYEFTINKPLKNTIKNKTSLIISPDGALRLLPFEALYDKEKNKYFIEEKEIRYIPSGKELVRLYKFSKDKKSKAAKSAVIFSNPNFNTKIASVSKEEIAITPSTSRSGIIKSLFRMRFTPLPGTKAEAKAIQSTLKKSTVSEYQKEKATESNLMKIKEPNILHIATHGFFINDNTIPNPMLKSGIALAGANASAIKGKSDGIVTALKLSGLDLKGTDLVVLSACQTGVVDINATDSVSGLSKAFIQAGAKDIVMSLWSVDDQATKDLMTSFYQEMKQNKNYAKALKSAKLKMIEEGRHPFYWAAFVVSGL